MLRDRNIAFFIDVDNLSLTSENYANVIEQLKGMGEIVYGKIYGAGERKHKEICDDAKEKGYVTDRPMRVKRRGRKDFDNRIFVDVVEAVNRAPRIDTVCIIAQPTDLVYLYSFLHSRVIKIVALDNADEASCAQIDEVVDLGIAPEIKLPKSKPQKAAKKPAKEAAPVQAAPAEEAPAKESAPAKKSSVDDMEELLRAIDSLKSDAERDKAAAAQEEAHEEPKAAEKPADNKAVREAIAKMEEEPAHAEEPKSAAKPRAQFTTQNSDLIRRIDELRRNHEGGDSEDLIDEIRKLLDMD